MKDEETTNMQESLIETPEHIDSPEFTESTPTTVAVESSTTTKKSKIFKVLTIELTTMGAVNLRIVDIQAPNKRTAKRVAKMLGTAYWFETDQVAAMILDTCDVRQSLETPFAIDVDKCRYDNVWNHAAIESHNLDAAVQDAADQPAYGVSPAVPNEPRLKAF